MRFALKRAWYFLMDNWATWLAVVLGSLVFWYIIKPVAEALIVAVSAATD